MRDSHKRFLMQISISAFVAVATPALTAGLMVGAQQVADAASTPVSISANLTRDTNKSATANSRHATRPPARLSPLAGDDKAAWENANSIHVQFKRRASAVKAVASR